MLAIDDLREAATEEQPVDEATLAWQQTIFKAIKEGDYRSFMRALPQGDINFKNDIEYSPLLYACTCNRKDFVQQLINLGADVNAKDFMDETALHRSAKKGWLQIAKSLVSKGADVNSIGCFGQTPLFFASMFQRLDVLKFLLDSGADPNILTEWHGTVLHLTSKIGRVSVVEILVKGGADVNARTYTGTTPLHETSLPEIAEILLQAGADCNLIDENNQGSFSNFVRNELSMDLLKLCIEYGALIYQADYRIMVSKPRMKQGILRNSKLCALAIANMFNFDLSKWYKLLPNTCCLFPSLDKLKIGCGSKVFEDIELLAKRDIKANGHCNVPKAQPIVLSMLCLGRLLEFYPSLTKLNGLFLNRPMKRVACPDAMPVSKSLRIN